MLDYIALIILIFVAITLFYGVIVIHDIPYEIAKKRNHPQQDALHVAGWVSLFTLHVLWPFLWIWATLYRKDRGWGFSDEKIANANNDQADNSANSLQLIKLQNRVEILEAALKQSMVDQPQTKETVTSTATSDINQQKGSL
jgi:CBS domain containing-hemolysin-like protein